MGWDGVSWQVTKNAVVKSSEHGVKASIRSPLMMPAVALIDPLLTASVPPAVTAQTGLDALCQCIEVRRRIAAVMRKVGRITG